MAALMLLYQLPAGSTSSARNNAMGKSKKKVAKKLSITSETVRTLTPTDVSGAAGGFTVLLTSPLYIAADGHQASGNPGCGDYTHVQGCYTTSNGQGCMG
jgi:hypothetical protein